MAASTVRLKGWKLPVHDLGVAAMAVRAGQVAEVILRFVGQAGVAVVGRRPCIRVVAQTTVLGCIEVAGVCTSCGRTVVAGRARSKHLIVIHVGDWHPGGRRMAIFANIGRQNV